MKTSEKKAKRISIFIATFIIISAIIITTGYLYYRYEVKSYRINMDQQLSTIADLKVKQIMQWREERLGDVSIFYKNDLFSSLVQKYFEKPKDAETVKQIQIWLEKVQKHYDYKRVCLIDANGVERLSIPKATTPIASVISRQHSEIMKSKQIIFQDFYRDEHDQHIYLAMLTPVLDVKDSNRVLGVLALQIDPEHYLYPSISSWPTPSKTSETLILRREGNEVVFLNRLKFKKDAALNLRAPMNGTKAIPAIKAALGEEGIVEALDYRGVPVIAAMRTIHNSPWFMVARMDTEEVYAPLRERLWVIVILIGALLIGAGAWLSLVWKQRSLRFYREKYEVSDKLRKSEERYEALIETSLDGFWVADTEGRLVEVNDAYCLMTGYTKEKLLSMRVSDVEAVETLDKTREHIEKLIAQGWDRFESKHRCADGKLIDVVISTIYLSSQNIILVFINNITDRKLADKILHESEERFRSVAQSANDAIVSADSTGTIAGWNRGAEKIFGYKESEIIGQSLTLIMPQDYREHHIKGLKRLELGGEKHVVRKTVELKGLHKNGNVFPLELSLAEWETSTGKYYTGIIRDITDRKLAEEALRAAKDELELRVKERTEELQIANEQLHRNYQIQTVLNSLLQLSLEDAPFDELLKRILELILSIPLLSVESKGGIFLVEDEPEILVLKAQKELHESLHTECARLPFGKCLCGRAALTQEIQFASSLDERHEISYEGIAPHGHYCVPIVAKDKTLGVINLYLKEGHRRELKEEEFLTAIANTLAGIILRKQAEETLKKLSSAVQQTADTIVITNREGIIEYVNPAFEHLTGFTSEEAIGKTPRILKSGTKEKKYYEELWETILDGRVFRTEMVNKKKTGELHYEEKTITPIVDVNGNITHFVASGKDVTLRKRTEQELIKAKEKAEEMNKLKSYFLSNMSHELRTPLISILGFAEILQLELNNKEHLEFVNHIMEGGHRLSNTLNSILELSKLESEKTVLNLTSHNLADEVIKRVESFKPMAQRKHLFIKTEINDKYLNANIDAELFGKALFQFVSNGIKFTKSGGVFVTLNHERKQELDYAVIKVIDTGIGISKENIEKIFGEFKQVSEGYSRSHEGTGIGLSIAKKIVEMMKGYIQVESEVGKGSVFSVWLPVILDENQIKSKVEEKRRTTVIEPPVKQDRDLHQILLVEDNPSNRNLIKRMLANGINIIEAEDGVTGVTYASQKRFDMILMDINLGPGMDGVEAMHQIRKIPGYARVPIIAVTAYVMSGDRERFLNEGFDNYLAKPFSKDVLVSLVEKCMAKVKK